MAALAIHLYSSTMAHFVDHWTNVNAELGGTPETNLKLAGGYTLAQFQAARAAIDAGLDDFANHQNLWEGSMFDRDQSRKQLRERLMQFRLAVQLYLANSRYERMLPDTPPATVAQGRLLEALRDVKQTWTQIDAAVGIAGFTPPLKLGGGYGLSQFTADLEVLEQRLDAASAAEDNLQQARKDRDVMLAAAYERMKQYRMAVPIHFSPDHPLMLTLPLISPSDTSGEGGGGGGGSLDAPGAPTLTTNGFDAVLVQWLPVSGATSYNVFRQIVGVDTDFVLVGPATTNTTTLDTLMPGSTIRVRLTALNAQEESNAGPHTEITLPMGP